MEIVTVVKGGHQYGYGHLTRSSALINRFKDSFQIRFLLIGDNLAEKWLINKGYIVQRVTYDNWIQFVDYGKTRAVILDHHDADYEQVSILIKNKILTISLDEHGPSENIVDFSFDGFNKKSIDGPKKYYGFKYFIIRENIVNLKKEYMSVDNLKKNECLVSFGATDPYFKTELFIESKFIDIFNKINLVLGPGFDRALNFIPKNVQVFKNPSNFDDMLSQSNCNILSGGLTAIESLFLGKPTFIFGFTDDEKTNFNCHSGQSLIYLDISSDQSLEHSLDLFLSYYENNLLMNQLLTNSQKLIDGRGLDRMVEIIHNHLKRNSDEKI